MKTAQQIGQTFRNQIRNRQKQQILRSIRQKYEPQTCIPRQSQWTILLSQLKSDSSLKICNRIIDTGMHNQLMENLKRGEEILTTLEILANVFSREKFRVAARFVKLGLIEELVRISQTGSYAVIDVCMNILANIVFENVQNAQIMMENNVHRHFFQLARKVIFSKQKLEKNEHDTGFNIMWALAALLEIQNAAPYKQQFLQILEFSLQLSQRDLYPKLLLQIIFLCGYNFRQQSQQQSHITIQKILSQTQTSSPYLQSLLIVIKLLSPLPIQYQKICMIALSCVPKLISYCLKIMLNVCNYNYNNNYNSNNNGNYQQIIPRTIQYWERLYLRLMRYEDVQLYLGVIAKLGIRAQWLYTIIFEILDKYSNYPTLINQVLELINTLLEKSETPEDRKKVKFYLRSTNICNLLAKFYEYKNAAISRKCQYLLNAVNLQLNR